MSPDLVLAALDEKNDDGADHDGDNGEGSDSDDNAAEAPAGVGVSDATGPTATHDVFGDRVGERFGGDVLKKYDSSRVVYLYVILIDMFNTYGELEGEVEHTNSWLDTRSHQSKAKIDENERSSDVGMNII